MHLPYSIGFVSTACSDFTPPIPRALRLLFLKTSLIQFQRKEDP